MSSYSSVYFVICLYVSVCSYNVEMKVLPEDGRARSKHVASIRVNKYVVASKSSRKSLVYFTEISSVNREMYLHILRRLSDAAGRKCTENGEPTFGISVTTMLEHTGRF